MRRDKYPSLAVRQLRPDWWIYLTIEGRLLPLTYKEFQLLRYLAQHAGQVFSRAQLLQELWSHDFVRDVRTVDVHVRRRARSSARSTST